MALLNLDDIVTVTVSTAVPAIPREGYNVGLILGKSEVISSSDRVVVVNDMAGVIAAGFASTTPEYKAAELYFSQNPRPAKLVIGMAVTGNDAETVAEALDACRAKNTDFYGVFLAWASVSAADHSAAAAWANTNKCCYFYQDDAAADITSATTDVFSVLKGLGYDGCCGLYSATPYAGAAVMGYAMGANDGTPNSAYTLAYKTLAGVTPDDLTEAQIGYLQGKNANYYVVRGGTYKVLETGVVASGKWFDEVIGVAQLARDLQLACVDVLANAKSKIPYTDAGALQFVIACNAVCQDAVERGFLAPGVWRQPTVLELETGDMLEAGYFTQVLSVFDRPEAEKTQRKCPPIYVCVNLAGAIHSVTIQVNVQ